MNESSQMKKILLVDDSEDNQFLIRTFLKGLPYLIEEASNGQLAIDKFIKGDFDLILMDMEMPIMDGYSASSRIREIERGERSKKIPIVALTAHTEESEIQKCKDTGCNYFLSKPINKEFLVSIISEILSSERS